MRFQLGDDIDYSYDEHDATLNLFTEQAVSNFHQSLQKINDRVVTQQFVNAILVPYLKVEAHRAKRLDYLRALQRGMLITARRRLKKDPNLRNPEVIRLMLAELGYDPITKTINDPLHYFVLNRGTYEFNAAYYDEKKQTPDMELFCKYLNKLYRRLPEAADTLSASESSSSLSSLAEESESIVRFKLPKFNREIKLDIHGGDVLFKSRMNDVDKMFVKEFITMRHGARENGFADHFQKYIIAEDFKKIRQDDLRAFKQKMLEVIRENPDEDWAVLLQYKVSSSKKGMLSLFSSRDYANITMDEKSVFYYLMNTGTKSSTIQFHTTLNPTASMKKLFTFLDEQQKRMPSPVKH